jgi:ribosomal protein S18 acetylase RimI-like enzyme
MLTFPKMTKSEFELYEAQAISEFAKDKIQAEKMSLDQALEVARKSYAVLLPDGFSSEKHHLYSIYEDGKSIGMLWFADLKGQAFVYDFLIDEKFRGKGYGKASLAWLDSEVMRLGFRAIKLHVFEHNHYARSLYEKVGFYTTGRTMIKNLNVLDEKIHHE